MEKFNLIQNQFVDLLEKLQFLIESTEVGWMEILSHKWRRKKRYHESRVCGCKCDSANTCDGAELVWVCVRLAC